MRRRPIIVLVLVALISLGMPRADALTSAESCFLSAIARERASAGRSRLSHRSDLAAIARRHSDRMARDGRIYHSSDLGRGVSGWTTIGENVGSGPRCADIHDAFMASASHRAIILGRSFTEVGIGVVIGDSDTICVTELFVSRVVVTHKRPHVRQRRPERVPPSLGRRPNPSPSPSRVASRCCCRSSVWTSSGSTLRRARRSASSRMRTL